MFEGQSIIDMLFQLLGQLLIPNWTDLIALLPWVLIVIVAVWLVFSALQWRRAGSRNRSRVPQRVSGAPPPGVHMPGPSRWPFVVPFGVALILFSLVLTPRDEQHNPTQLLNVPLLVIGLIVSVVAVIGWLRDANREWRTTAAGAHGPALAVTLPAYGATSALIPAGATGMTVAERYPEPPAGVHMPGPSPWPFFAPIALFVMLLGVVFSAMLLIGGLILGIIAAAGWLLDAGHEYRSTEVAGHAVPTTRDPSAVWPRRLVPLYGAVIVISFLLMLAPTGIGFLNSLTPPEATPPPIAVPAVPVVGANSAISFDTKTLIVPAGRPFELTFNNNQAGVPHNVDIGDSAAAPTTYLHGERIDGVASITYQVAAIPAGTYYFQCEVHTNMNGTVQAMPESGAPAGSPSAGSPPAGSPPAGTSPTP
ncbi:MAG TPA: cupredoxin domain-containing protein [Candidatus Limnocylindria bacterium]|nr:cupredoxin domain-containing protein [Candidatus Limnocylindria bacterium]